MLSIALLFLAVLLLRSISRAWYPSDVAPQKLMLIVVLVALWASLGR